MYDPKIGRWLSQDPLGFDAGDSNLYRYVGNGPTNGIDATGLELQAIARRVLGAGDLAALDAGSSEAHSHYYSDVFGELKRLLNKKYAADPFQLHKMSLDRYFSSNVPGLQGTRTGFGRIGDFIFQAATIRAGDKTDRAFIIHVPLVFEWDVIDTDSLTTGLKTVPEGIASDERQTLVVDGKKDIDRDSFAGYSPMSDVYTRAIPLSFDYNGRVVSGRRIILLDAPGAPFAVGRDSTLTITFEKYLARTSARVKKRDQPVPENDRVPNSLLKGTVTIHMDGTGGAPAFPVKADWQVRLQQPEERTILTGGMNYCWNWSAGSE